MLHAVAPLHSAPFGFGPWAVTVGCAPKFLIVGAAAGVRETLPKNLILKRNGLQPVESKQTKKTIEKKSWWPQLGLQKSIGWLMLLIQIFFMRTK